MTVFHLPGRYSLFDLAPQFLSPRHRLDGGPEGRRERGGGAEGGTDGWCDGIREEKEEEKKGEGEEEGEEEGDRDVIGLKEGGGKEDKE